MALCTRVRLYWYLLGYLYCFIYHCKICCSQVLCVLCPQAGMGSHPYSCPHRDIVELELADLQGPFKPKAFCDLCSGVAFCSEWGRATHQHSTEAWPVLFESDKSTGWGTDLGPPQKLVLLQTNHAMPAKPLCSPLTFSCKLLILPWAGLLLLATRAPWAWSSLWQKGKTPWSWTSED